MTDRFSKFKKVKKKGNAIIDTAIIFMMLFIFAIVIISGYRMFKELNDDMQADADLGNTSKEQIGDLYSRYPSTFDSLFMFAFILLWVMVIAASFLINSHPMFFIIAIIILAFVFIALMYFANTYDEMMDDSELSAFRTEFPMINWVMTHLLEMGIAVGMTVLISLYAKSKLINNAF